MAAAAKINTINERTAKTIPEIFKPVVSKSLFLFLVNIANSGEKLITNEPKKTTNAITAITAYILQFNIYM